MGGGGITFITQGETVIFIMHTRSSMSNTDKQTVTASNSPDSD